MNRFLFKRSLYISLVFSATTTCCVVPLNVLYLSNHQEIQKIDIQTLIPKNQNIGEIFLAKNETIPTEAQIIGSINKLLIQKGDVNRFFPNQIFISNITTSTANVFIKEWSPNYESKSSTSLFFSTKKINQISLWEAFSGTGLEPKEEFNLNEKFSFVLENKNPEDIQKLKGIENTANLLEWLNSNEFYGHSLFVNQIFIKDPLEWNKDKDCYSFVLGVYEKSLSYLSGDLKILFNVSRNDLYSMTTIKKVLSFVIRPSTPEVSNQFLFLNEKIIDLSKIKETELEISQIETTGCSLGIQKNEFYLASNLLEIKWENPAKVDIDKDIIKRNYLFVENPKIEDLIYFVEVENKTSFDWDNLIIVFNYPQKTAEISVKKNSLFYVDRTVNISWELEN